MRLVVDMTDQKTEQKPADHKAIREALEASEREWRVSCFVVGSDLRALLADLYAMRAKAARYDYLRDASQICGSMTGRGVALPSYETNNEQRTYLDECIDAALKGAEA